MKKFTTLGIMILALSTISFTAGKSDFCHIKNSAYKEGEVITFKVFIVRLAPISVPGKRLLQLHWNASMVKQCIIM